MGNSFSSQQQHEQQQQDEEGKPPSPPAATIQKKESCEDSLKNLQKQNQLLQDSSSRFLAAARQNVDIYCRNVRQLLKSLSSMPKTEEDGEEGEEQEDNKPAAAAPNNNPAIVIKNTEMNEDQENEEMLFFKVAVAARDLLNAIKTFFALSSPAAAAVQSRRENHQERIMQSICINVIYTWKMILREAQRRMLEKKKKNKIKKPASKQKAETHETRRKTTMMAMMLFQSMVDEIEHTMKDMEDLLLKIVPRAQSFEAEVEVLVDSIEKQVMEMASENNKQWVAEIYCSRSGALAEAMAKDKELANAFQNLIECMASLHTPRYTVRCILQGQLVTIQGTMTKKPPLTVVS